MHNSCSPGKVKACTEYYVYLEVVAAISVFFCFVLLVVFVCFLFIESHWMAIRGYYCFCIQKSPQAGSEAIMGWQGMNLGQCRVSSVQSKHSTAMLSLQYFWF